MNINNRFMICIAILIFILSGIFTCFATSGEQKYRLDIMSVVATAYCPCSKCCNKEVMDGKTATGRDASKPGIAVDPNIIPYGSRIDCKEYTRKPTWALADDCGGSIKKNRIDLRMETHEEAVNFGKQEVVIRVWIKL